MDFLALQTGFELKQDSNLIQQVLDRLIEDRLLQEKAKQETILVTKSEIENELKESINQLISKVAMRPGKFIDEKSKPKGLLSKWPFFLLTS